MLTKVRAPVTTVPLHACVRDGRECARSVSGLAKRPLPGLLSPRPRSLSASSRSGLCCLSACSATTLSRCCRLNLIGPHGRCSCCWSPRCACGGILKALVICCGSWRYVEGRLYLLLSNLFDKMQPQHRQGYLANYYQSIIENTARTGTKAEYVVLWVGGRLLWWAGASVQLLTKQHVTVNNSRWQKRENGQWLVVCWRMLLIGW